MRDDVLSSWHDLRQFGINFLTGESCGIGMRALCDLTRDGKELIEEFFGGNLVCQDQTEWNSGVSSILLPRGIFTELAAFCLLKKYDVVMVTPGEARGYSAEDWPKKGQPMLDFYREQGMKGCRTYQKYGTAGGGTRNRHLMSGRIS